MERMAPPLTILYFAWVRERVGTGEEACELPDGGAELAGLGAWLTARSPGHAAAFAEPALVRAAVNQVFAKPDTRVGAGDEVAFFPPVTGG